MSENKTVIVTGASQGIGAAIVQALLDRQYNVVAQLGDGKAENGDVGSRRNQSRSRFTAGKFITPHDAIFLHNGDILVAEWLPIGRITLLRKA